MNNSDSQKRAFCVVLKKGKKTLREEGDSHSEFLPLLKNAELAWINFVLDDVTSEGEAIAKSLGFSPDLVTTLLSSRQSNYEDRDVELGIKVPAVRTKDMEVSVYPLIILIRKGLILSFHDKAVTRLVKFSRYAETFMRKMGPDAPWEDRLTLLLWRILDENNARNFDNLREIEEQADELVKSLMDPTTPSHKLGPQIYKMKHALIMYLDSLWAMLDVVNTLRYGDSETMTDNESLLNRISLLSADITAHISISEHMSEVLASGLEVLQSIYNNQLQLLNNRLSLVVAWLTIVGTAVLVPNTLATIFGIPSISEHLDWTLITLIIILSTILSALAAYWAVKAKKILPKSQP
jgi:magnesium transporter